MQIAGRDIGPEHPPYVICELSGNHNGELSRALELVDMAAKTGCDAIKLQTYTPDTLTLDSDRPEFRLTEGPWAGRTLYELYAEAQTPYDWHEALFDRARFHGVTMFSTPFDETAVELLESLGAPAYKIASLEARDIPLIQRVAATGKPMIISTGGCDTWDIDDAYWNATFGGAAGVALLHCVSEYPTPIANANVRRVQALAARFDCPVGLSDHTLGSAAAVAAVALGASVIEKHFTLSRALGGPDASFSLEPYEFAVMAAACRDAWQALGDPDFVAETPLRRSLYVVAPVKAGERFTRRTVRSVRPGGGLAPKRLNWVLARCAKRDMAPGDPLTEDAIL